MIRTDDHEVVQFDGPVLELMTEGRTRFDQRLAALGPDVLRREFDEPAFLRRLREDDQTRGLGEALLDQRIVAGLGTVWKSEGCFLAGLSPWRRLGGVSDDEALADPRVRRWLGRARRQIRDPRPAAARPGSRRARRSVGVRAHRPSLPPLPTPIRFRGQGDDNRNTYWCPQCQR